MEVVAVKAVPMKCMECRQLLDDPELKLYPGDSSEAVSCDLKNVPAHTLFPPAG